ncbi:glutamate-gated chloride channel alpha-like [Stegodyphus dumicola]|uniref:glutamate-gated chloride channel alpha-like n=1 Tax=Stegodyphus dumicola TaxID=202533 RepID=UPI0015A7796A|nr:glutamate-gated chloride channel alpha-like [Stegodyphus dumicola]
MYSGVFPPDYNKYEAPTVKGKAAHVYFQMHVMDVDRIDEGLMEFSIQSYLSEVWEDKRLNLSIFLGNKEGNVVFPVVLSNYIWTPDLVFDNAKSGHLFDLSLPNKHLRVLRESVLLRSSRFSLVISCQMNFHHYPMDTQHCFLKIAFLSNPDHIVELHWSEEKEELHRKSGQSILLTNNIQPLKYELLPPTSYKTKEEWIAGNFTYLYANFTFVRRISGSLLNVYVPSMLVVFLSWISFWLDVAAVPARITLGVTSLLTLATQVVQAHNGLPPISYMTAMDIWLFACLITVFGSLLEYAFAYQTYFAYKQHTFVCPQRSDIPMVKVGENLNGIRTSSTELSSRLLFRKPLKEIEHRLQNNKMKVKERTLDNLCRKLFPLAFTTFAVIYWTFYLLLK